MENKVEHGNDIQMQFYSSLEKEDKSSNLSNNKIVRQIRRLFLFFKRGIELQFLNFRIIQWEHGISIIDQTNHTLQSILNDYFDKNEKIKYESRPFPLDDVGRRIKKSRKEIQRKL